MTKNQFYQSLMPHYQELLLHMRYRLMMRFGSQRKLADFLQIDYSHLSKILSGTVKCNSLLFFHLVVLASMDIVDDDFFKKSLPVGFDKE